MFLEVKNPKNRTPKVVFHPNTIFKSHQFVVRNCNSDILVGGRRVKVALAFHYFITSFSSKMSGGMFNWSDNTEDEDFAFALQLSEYADNNNNNNDNNNNNNDNDTNSERSAIAKKPSSVIDPSWELIDPIPDIRELFVQFNETYFDGKVASVEVKWSPRMTTCAGICRYQGRGGLCSIGLSTPLLKLRPRSDLVNTLLHEMIHALLFVTNNNTDREGHGGEFHKHMHRINAQSGSNITVYHTFHDGYGDTIQEHSTSFLDKFL